jgi:hypothetical protein
MSMSIKFVRCAAPSFKALAMAGLGRPRKGNVPSMRVVVATDDQGCDWQHERLFKGHEGELARKLMDRVENAGAINLQHWRKTKGEY